MTESGGPVSGLGRSGIFIVSLFSDSLYFPRATQAPKPKCWPGGIPLLQVPIQNSAFFPENSDKLVLLPESWNMI